MQSFNGSDERNGFRPPAPEPHVSMPSTVALLKALWNNPIEAWTWEHFERPIVVTRLPVGEVAVVSEPRAVRRVLSENAGNYPKDRFQKRMLAVLRGGVLVAEDEQWRSQRRTIAPVFTLKNIRSFAPPMLFLIEELVLRLRRADGMCVDIATEVTDLALLMLERTIFTEGITRNYRDLGDAMRTYFDSLGRIDPFDLMNLPDFIPRLSRLRARPAIDRLHAVVDEMIATRRSRLAAEPGDVPYDILTLLLNARDPQTGQGLTEGEIRANVMTLMAAGHESTANAVTWALYLLSRSPHWRARVAAEARRELDGSGDDLVGRLVETRAVVDEALRLYPPLAAISRVAAAADELAGVPIRRGAMIVIAPYVMHRHRRWWGRPDVFDPAKFLPGARETIDRYVYLPFGAGMRGCIGASFALQQATLAVAAITRHFELAVAPGHEVWPVHRITLRPRGGLPMIVRRRQAVRGPAAQYAMAMSQV
jgi:cytochrome P450